MNHNRFNSFN